MYTFFHHAATFFHLHLCCFIIKYLFCIICSATESYSSLFIHFIFLQEKKFSTRHKFLLQRLKKKERKVKERKGKRGKKRKKKCQDIKVFLKPTLKCCLQREYKWMNFLSYIFIVCSKCTILPVGCKEVNNSCTEWKFKELVYHSVIYLPPTFFSS